VEPNQSIVMDVDPLRLSQAISDLLTNAAKYSAAAPAFAIALPRSV
jgi:signal transduction histidine kinase